MIFLRYLIIQVLGYGIDMGSFLLAIRDGAVEPNVANIFSKLAAGCFAFVAHRSFTFGVVTSGCVRRQAIRYFSLVALYAPVSSAILELNLTWLPAISESNPIWLPPAIRELNLSWPSLPVMAKFLSDIMCVALSYTLSKYFIFSKSGALPGNTVTGSKT
jgi:putative flippase GtrA